MKPFEELTQRGQAQRLRALARSALADYGLDRARLTYIAHAANTTFRVDIPDGAFPGAGRTSRGVRRHYTDNRFLLRIHRPGYQTAASIASELMWLSALSREQRLAVPEPVPTVHGTWLTTVTVPGVPQPRHCSLLRWMEGRFLRQRPRPRHVEEVGKFMARLHQHAAHWRPPAAFVRRHWDWEGLFGNQAGFSLPAKEVWKLLPHPYFDLFTELTDRVKQVMIELGRGIEAYGLIHADLNFYNILFSTGAAREPRVFDFDDCGYGYWLYDIAVTLSDWQGDEGWPELRDAFLNGYAQVRPVPLKHLVHLDLFMAAQHVAEALWVTDMAQGDPGARDVMAEWQEWAAEQVGEFLDGETTY
jgi:Ser/Thr protein kinase RdoA (MazF antagonist)